MNRLVTLALCLCVAGCDQATSTKSETLAPQQPTSSPTSSPTPAANQFDVELDKAAMEGLCRLSVSDSMQALHKSLSYLDTALPNLTPEEAAYLEREDKAAYALYQDESTSKVPNHAGSNARYGALANRRLYRVWIARKALARAILSVQAIDDLQGAYKAFAERPSINTVLPSEMFRREKADVLYRMQSAVNNLSDAQGALREFMLSEGYRPAGVLTTDQSEKVVGSSGLVMFDLAQAMNCQLAHLALDPP
jgi:hypothetical protein